jgi:hypothetical protein
MAVASRIAFTAWSARGGGRRTQDRTP